MRNKRTADIGLSVNKLVKTDSAELTTTDEEAAVVLSEFFKGVLTVEKDEPVGLCIPNKLYEYNAVNPVTFDIDRVKKEIE